MARNASHGPAVRYQDRPNVLSLKGEIDLHIVPAVVERLTAMIRLRPERLVVDLSGATYIDSAGLAALMITMREVEAFGGKFFLTGLNETVRSVFETSRLDQTFRIFPDVDTALAASNR